MPPESDSAMPHASFYLKFQICRQLTADMRGMQQNEQQQEQQ